jgi:hypothetical protein
LLAKAMRYGLVMIVSMESDEEIAEGNDEERY